MKYITRRRYKKKCIQGNVNLPFGTTLYSIGNMIYYNNKPVCLDTSQDAFDYLVSNEDDQGLLRIKLIDYILEHTSSKYQNNNSLYEKIWEKIWSTEKYQKLRRQDHEDRWLWYKEFYIADIDLLQMLVNDIKIIEQGDHP